MRTIGIISEYNPFHSGHRYHIKQVRRQFGDESAVVCVMSGNWVQRGDAAITDKWSRARMALEGGADLILELPTLWAAASAEIFARAGVALLDAAGCVDVLSFGSEAGALTPLATVADCFRSEAFPGALRIHLNRGLSFPAARQRTAESLVPESAACLRGPNNILGIEYLLALRDRNSRIQPHTLPRQGAGHDRTETEASLHWSASALRERILNRDPAPLTPYLSPEQESLLRRDPASLTLCAQGVLARLRSMEEEDFAALPDSGEGFHHRLYEAACAGRSLEEIFSLARTKRYPLARIRRTILWAFLGLTEADRPAQPPYLRVLGFSQKGQRLLHRMKSEAGLPLIVKPAHARRLAPADRRVFELEARCTRLYALCRSSSQTSPVLNEYLQNPVR